MKIKKEKRPKIKKETKVSAIEALKSYAKEFVFDYRPVVYDIVKNTVPGKLSLDEASQSQMFFLAKYLGNYDINKIGNKFLIRNESKAIVIEKDRW